MKKGLIKLQEIITKKVSMHPMSTFSVQKHGSISTNGHQMNYLREIIGKYSIYKVLIELGMRELQFVLKQSKVSLNIMNYS